MKSTDRKKPLTVYIDPDFIHDSDYIQKHIQSFTGHPAGMKFRIIRRSIDARRKRPVFVLQVVPETELVMSAAPSIPDFGPVKSDKTVIIVGAGPAGYFAALELLFHGIRPVVVERGEDVKNRRKQVARLLKTGHLDPDSNYCFGEGGAGTFSDGKLYTRSDKRGNVRRVLELLVAHGADPDILIDVQPHIGSNRLPKIVKRIRQTILDHGGDVLFHSRVTDIVLHRHKAVGVRLANGQELIGNAVILATGHSARDIFQWFHGHGFLIESKPIALGVRVEHPQDLIDRIQYHHSPRHRHLPPATYRLVSRVDGRGVYSFCMCPGGYVVPTATSENELVINGMSMSGRKGPLANSGIVVEIGQEEVARFGFSGPFEFLDFQEMVEHRTFISGGGQGQQAPAQRMVDFVKGNASTTLPATSYLPGVRSAPLHEILPSPIRKRLQKAFVDFGKKKKGYFTNEALVLAVESRTSSPIRIPRDPRTLMHPQIENLYPCGEGAGYAGGIVSSAMDGQRVAQKALTQIHCST